MKAPWPPLRAGDVVVSHRLVSKQHFEAAEVVELWGRGLNRQARLKLPDGTETHRYIRHLRHALGAERGSFVCRTCDTAPACASCTEPK